MFVTTWKLNRVGNYTFWSFVIFLFVTYLISTCLYIFKKSKPFSVFTLNWYQLRQINRYYLFNFTFLNETFNFYGNNCTSLQQGMISLTYTQCNSINNTKYEHVFSITWKISTYNLSQATSSNMLLSELYTHVSKEFTSLLKQVRHISNYWHNNFCTKLVLCGLV